MKNNNSGLNKLGEDPILIENTLKAALDSNFSSVMLTSAEAGYPTLHVNPAFTELTGYSSDELLCFLHFLRPYQLKFFATRFTKIAIEVPYDEYFIPKASIANSLYSDGRKPC